jgi:purine-nucleoside phosphorylase
MLEKIKSTANYISERIQTKAELCIILGTGLGGLTREIQVKDELSYSEIPNFPLSTVDGHAGKLISGTLCGKEILAMQGRFHYYEGYSMKEVTFPIRVMRQLGIKTLIVSNACGGLNPDYEVGDIMVISDHINFFPEHPLRGPNLDELGPRFPDMSRVYDPELRDKARQIAAEYQIGIREGVYVGVSGPTFETPAEYMMFRLLGGDVVGMSTVPEVIVAHHSGMRIFGVSVITDSGVPGQIREISHDEVQHVASEAEPKMTLLLKKLIPEL